LKGLPLISFQVKTPDSFMLWYLKSKIFIESVINLNVCEADLFIDGQLQKRRSGHKLGAVYQILDENTPRMFSSLKRMLLDYLQPSAVQLVGNLNDCLRRCFDRSRSTVCRLTSSSSMPSLVPTILRSSQSGNGSSDSEPDSPRLPMRISPSSNVQPAAEVALDSVPSAGPNSIRLTTSVVCLIEYTASVQRSWHWLKPSIVPHSLAMRSDLVSRTGVLGVANANNCRDYIFCPTAVLPDARSGSVVSFPKVLLQLTDSKGQQLDSRELDNLKIDLSAAPSSAFKGSVFRNTGYSIRVRQYFLQIEAAVLAAADAFWWYMNDSGRLRFFYFRSVFFHAFHTSLLVQLPSAVLSRLQSNNGGSLAFVSAQWGERRVHAANLAWSEVADQLFAHGAAQCRCTPPLALVAFMPLTH
jgi:hypothetical protein